MTAAADDTGRGGAISHPSLEAAYLLASSTLFKHGSEEDLFNPYHDRNSDLDKPDAVRIRRGNLRNYFAAYDTPPEIFLLAEAPGPWGCRFSGVPITAESQLLDPAFPLSGRQSSLRAEPHTEYSAGIFWRLLKAHFPRFIVWNTVPLHPHPPGEPLKIRTPRTSEIRRWAPLAADLIRILNPKTVLAVGRKAEKALADVGVAATYVRHPSQGGATRFREGVLAALGEAHE